MNTHLRCRKAKCFSIQTKKKKYLVTKGPWATPLTWVTVPINEHIYAKLWLHRNINQEKKKFLKLLCEKCFVCLGFFVPLQNFSLIWRRHHYRWKAANFDLRSALTAIEQWGFFSVPHLLWHGLSVYNGHLLGPKPLTSIAESLAVELSLYLFLRLRSVAAGIRASNLPLAGRTLLTDCSTAAVCENWNDSLFGKKAWVS